MTPEQAQTLVGREFVHFKGNRYKLLAIAKHSETLEPIVVYRALYGEGGEMPTEDPPGARQIVGPVSSLILRK